MAREFAVYKTPLTHNQEGFPMKARILFAVFAVALLGGSALADEAPKVETPRVDAVAAVEPAEPAAVPAAETIDVDEACELNYTPAEPEDDAAALSSKPSCRSCRDNPGCACRYNGLPRVSCDPCCWGNLGIPQICSS
jgi:hypothetical protein